MDSMNIIVFQSDVARLVHGYLINHNLSRAAEALLQSSPYLENEFLAFQQGIETHHLCKGGLEHIIKEHVQVTRVVTQAVNNLPPEKRIEFSNLKLWEQIRELVKQPCENNTSNTSATKRRFTENDSQAVEEQPQSCKRLRLAPHISCNVELYRPNQSIENGNQTNNNSASEHHCEQNSPNRQENNAAPRLFPTPQSMPGLSQAILSNPDFTSKLLKNINVALRTVSAPPNIDPEHVLDNLVKNVLEATVSEPSFEQIIQEVVSGEDDANKESNEDTQPVAGSPVPQPSPEFTLHIQQAPPETPLIIRTAVASCINGDTSINTLVDPNFSISKLILINSNESAQKQPPSESANVSFNENLLNYGENLVSDPASAFGSQVCLDATQGQLTFPMYLTSDGLLPNFPFLVNNEWLAQQVRADVFANADVSHIEIPLQEPIILQANQLPPNSIIIGSAQKQTPSANANVPDQLSAVKISQSTAEKKPPSSQKPAAATTAIPLRKVEIPKVMTEKPPNVLETSSVVPASLDSLRMQVERVTPSTSGICNQTASRSLSTPRKRPHVRTLNFSPRISEALPSFGPALANTPLSTRRNQLVNPTAAQTGQANIEAAPEPATAATFQPEAPIVNNLEITNSSSGTASSPTNMNESSNSAPAFFAMEESSNQTVIKAITIKKQPKNAKPTKKLLPASAMQQTPKRRQKRDTAFKACKRIIAQKAAEEAPSPKQTKTVAAVSAVVEDHANASKENQMAPVTENKPVDAQNDVLTKADEHAAELAAWNQAKQTSISDLETRLREINACRQLTTSVRKPRRNLNVKNDQSYRARRSRRRNKKQRVANNSGEFNIKITTPRKSGKTPAKQELLKSTVKEVVIKAPADKPVVSAVNSGPSGSSLIPGVSSTAPCPIKQLDAEHEKRTANIAALLDTPFKEYSEPAALVPPTPGIMMMPQDTPFSKLMHSASSLFGSDTKSIIDTPLLNAITPGARFTPFGMSQDTPRSDAKTEYSSAGSYYRPDEAEEPNANTRHNTPLYTETESEAEAQTKLIAEVSSIDEHNTESNQLQRVRSFGTEATDGMDNAAPMPEADVDPDLAPYTQLVNAAYSSSSCTYSSSSSSSDSSSSSGNSSTSSSSSSSSSSSANSVQLPPKSIQASTEIDPTETNSKQPSETVTQHQRQLADKRELDPKQPSEKDTQQQRDLDPKVPSEKVTQQKRELTDKRELDPKHPSEKVTQQKRELADKRGLDPKPPSDKVTQQHRVLDPKLPSEKATQQKRELTDKRELDPKHPSEKVTQQKRELADKRGLDLKPPSDKVTQQQRALDPRLPSEKVTQLKRELADKRELDPKPPSEKVIQQQRELADKRERVRQKVVSSEQKIPTHSTAVTKHKKITSMLKKTNPVSQSFKPATPAETVTKSEHHPKAQPSSTINGERERDRDPELLKALNLSAKKQQPTQPPAKKQINKPRKTIQIDPQPQHSSSHKVVKPIAKEDNLSCKRRGRPKKEPSEESLLVATRRSSRLLEQPPPNYACELESIDERGSDTKSTEPIQDQALPDAKLVATKRPAKKRAEARSNELQPTVVVAETAKITNTSHRNDAASTVSKAQSKKTTQQPKVETVTTTVDENSAAKKKSSPKEPAAQATKWEQDVLRAVRQAKNTYIYKYDNDGPKNVKPAVRMPPSYYKDFKTLLVLDDEEHTLQIMREIVLHEQAPGSSAVMSNAAVIRNIPKKRMFSYPISSPSATSTPLAAVQEQSETAKVTIISKPDFSKADDTDLEVAAINKITPNESETQPEEQLEGNNEGMHIEDIESILSRLHGT